MNHYLLNVHIVLRWGCLQEGAGRCVSAWTEQTCFIMLGGVNIMPF